MVGQTWDLLVSVTYVLTGLRQVAASRVYGSHGASAPSNTQDSKDIILPVGEYFLCPIIKLFSTRTSLLRADFQQMLC